MQYGFTCIWGRVNGKSLTVHIVSRTVVQSQLHGVLPLGFQVSDFPSMLLLMYWRPATAAGRTGLLEFNELGLPTAFACIVFPVTRFLYDGDTSHPHNIWNNCRVCVCNGCLCLLWNYVLCVNLWSH